MQHLSDHASPKAEALVDRYLHRPDLFIQECVIWPNGAAPASYQVEIARRLGDEKRLAVRAPRGTGKTATAALLVHWFSQTRNMLGEDWKVITTASAWRQLSDFLWPEIRLWARRLDWEQLGRSPLSPREMQQMAVRLNWGSAFAVASNDPNKVEGGHAQHLFWLFDESKAIPDAIFDSAEGSMARGQESGGETLALAISTPGRRSGRFYHIFQRREGLRDWHTMKVTTHEAVGAGRVSAEWVQRMGRLWGVTSPLYRMQVEAEFAEEALSGIIPLEWIEAANARWREWQARVKEGEEPPPATSIGVDVGEGGPDGDPTVLVVVRGGVLVEELDKHQYMAPGTELMEVAGLVGSLLDQHGCPAYIDSIGIGSGVVARLREQHYEGALSFDAGRRTDLVDASREIGFLNWRAAMWWLAREMLDPDSGLAVALPPDDELTEELVIPQGRLTSASRHQVESKDEIKRRLRRGRSTNCADAVLQALVGPVLVEELERAGQVEIVYRPRRAGERW